jgi:hypothetical protein
LPESVTPFAFPLETCVGAGVGAFASYIRSFSAAGEFAT